MSRWDLTKTNFFFFIFPNLDLSHFSQPIKSLEKPEPMKELKNLRLTPPIFIMKQAYLKLLLPWQLYVTFFFLTL